MLLETLLKQGDEHTITNIFTREHITFFKVDGESFCTSSGHVHHHTSPMFDSAPLKMFAKDEHDEESKKKHLAMMEQVEYEQDLWDKYRSDIIKILVIKAYEILRSDGVQDMLLFLDSHLDIMAEEPARILAKKMEDENERD